MRIVTTLSLEFANASLSLFRGRRRPSLSVSGNMMHLGAISLSYQNLRKKTEHMLLNRLSCETFASCCRIGSSNAGYYPNLGTSARKALSNSRGKSNSPYKSMGLWKSGLLPSAPLANEVQGDISDWEVAIQNMFHLLKRGCKGKLLPTDLASQIFHIIQQHIATDPPNSQSERYASDTPGLLNMGWALWELVDELAREDQRHHDVLIGFINAFFPLLHTQPWVAWGYGMRETNLALGIVFRESLQGAGSFAEEARMRSWCNYCRFVARMIRDTEQNFSWYLYVFAEDALDDDHYCGYFEAAVIAFEGVIDVYGVQMYQKDLHLDNPDGGLFKGRPGFCKASWLLWENKLLHIAQDKAQYPARVRNSARRAASKIQSIRSGRLESRENDKRGSRDCSP